MFEIIFLGDLKPFKCPRDWAAYAGHCYRIYRTPKIWKEAQSSCRKEDGELASIHNIEEYSFTVSQLGYSKYFIWNYTVTIIHLIIVTMILGVCWVFLNILGQKWA